MTLTSYYKSPLLIYIVWHPNNSKGLEYAEELYNHFCRDTHSPLSRGLNIPIRFRYISMTGKKVPPPIDTTIADRIAIVLLADEEMFMDDDWQEYVNHLIQLEDSNTRLYSVALSEYAFSINDKLSKKQFINLTKIGTADDEESKMLKISEIRSRLLHDLCRFFYKLSKVNDTNEQATEPPVKLFISHAKIDGEKLAMEFRDFVQSKTKLSTFFDVNDIADAEDFESAITRNLKNSAIVVFLTDKYSTREWCQIEVLVAKRNKSPLVVVNNLEYGEKRSFPYLGNVPTLRYLHNSFDKIVDLALFQVLNNLFFEEKLNKEIALYSISETYQVYKLENAPELFNYVDIKTLKENTEKKLLVLYPDPPLGTEELRVLNDIDKEIQFTTPSLIHKLLINGK